jgi:uncharacterized surface protein with fasciclin (FAS1) repeats
MKKRSISLAWLIAVLFGLGSCTKSSSVKTNPLTPLNALINTDTSLSLFHHLILTANETGLLADNSITWLMPTNAAFRAAGYTAAGIDSLAPSVADRIVSYHFITQRAEPDSNGYKPYPTHLGLNIFGQLDNNKQTWFNGATAGDTANVGKALVYRLDAILLSPLDSLSIQLSSDTSLSFTAELFRRTGLDTTLTLSAGNYTVLAPDNAAWAKAGYDSVWRIDSADINTMTTLAKYHVLPGRWFIHDLSGINSIITLQGGSLTVGVSGGVLQFTGAGNASPANLLTGNQPAGNTFVIHKIDELLSP